MPMMVPKFKTERQESEWWDAHPEVITSLFLKAKKYGTMKRLSATRPVTRPVTLRIPLADLETAQTIAERRGLPYQTYIKGLLHQALEQDRRAE